MKIAIIGATGLVGNTMLKVLEEQRYMPLENILELIFVASEKNEGKEIVFNNRKYLIQSVKSAIEQKPTLVFLLAGNDVSSAYSQTFANNGAFVIDNSSYWRLNNSIPLVVPEVNENTLNIKNRIIANPNCSTIQLVVAIAQLHKQYNIKRLVISTYQSVTGSGAKAVLQLNNERNGVKGQKVFYPHSIDLNIFPHGGVFDNEGNTSEELKLINETRKIFNETNISITATVVRVPVLGGHSESVNIEFYNPFKIDDIYCVLKATQGVVIQDDTDKAVYPMPKYCEGRDEVFVGRIRRDNSIENGLNLWIVADNLRKGAAVNAVQIAASLIKKKFINI